jgi:hypothetical protein
MQKITLQFNCLRNLASFSKMLPGNYILNTTNLTITTNASEELLERAVIDFEATVIQTTEKVFSYGRVS